MLYVIFSMIVFYTFHITPAGPHNIFYFILSCQDNYFLVLYLYLLYIFMSIFLEKQPVLGYLR